MKRIVPKIKDFHMPPSNCLGCGRELDGAMSIDHRKKPRPGMITICLSCHHIMAFDWQLKLRELTDQEIIDIAGDRVILMAMAALAALKQEQGKHK